MPGALSNSISFSDLSIQVNTMLYGAHRPNTNRTYSSAQRQYIKFCDMYDLNPFPASEQNILWFLAFLDSVKKFKSHGLRASSMQVYLSAIRSLHIKLGLDAPPINTPRVKLALKYVLENSPPPNKKHPITYQLLQAILSMMVQSYDNLLYKAALTLAFYGGLRGAEYSVVLEYGNTGNRLNHIPRMADVIFGGHDGDRYLQYTVQKSKTCVHGFVVTIGCSGTHICSVCSMHEYLAARTSRNCLSGEDYLFQFSDNSVLSKFSLNLAIKFLVSKLGLDPGDYSSHSIRSGVATTASSCLFQDYEISLLGNWRSSVYKNYIRNVSSLQKGFAKRLAQAQS